MRRLYTHSFSIVPWRVRIALHEKGLDYETVKIDLFGKKPDAGFLELNPFAQIPVLDDDGFVVAESLAILEYLEEKYLADVCYAPFVLVLERVELGDEIAGRRRFRDGSIA